MKKIFVSLSLMICGVASLMITASPLVANERPEIDVARELVGQNRLSRVDESAIDEQRLEEEVTYKEMTQQDESDIEVCAYSFETYTVVHQGAFHYPTSITTMGNLVELNDGSVWVVADNDAFDTLNWSVADAILILPNHSWFSNYDYRLVNVATGVSVRVSLSQAPYYKGANTYYITGIDYNEGFVYLNDGSCFRITYFDRSSILSKWKYNDTIIIGTNDDWLSSSCCHSLINVTVLNYARAQCLN